MVYQTPDHGINLSTPAELKLPLGDDVSEKPLGWYRTMFDMSRIPERMWAEICDGMSFFRLLFVSRDPCLGRSTMQYRLGSYHVRIAGCFCPCCDVFSERTVEPREVRIDFLHYATGRW